MSLLDDIIGPVRYSIPMEYHLFKEGLYTPSEERPVIRVPGKRLWYAPWKRSPDKVYFGMSEAMAYRAQQAMELITRPSPGRPTEGPSS